MVFQVFLLILLPKYSICKFQNKERSCHLLQPLWTKLFPFWIDVIFQEFTETVQRQIHVHVSKDFTQSCRSFILFLAGYIPVCAFPRQQLSSVLQTEVFEIFWLLLQCSRVFHHLGFCAVSVGSSLPAFYTLTLHKILEDKKPKLFDITCYCLKNVVDFQCPLRVLYNHLDDFRSKTEGFFS